MDIVKFAEDENQEMVEEGKSVSHISSLLMLLGFVLVAVGIAVILVAAVLLGSGSANVGAVIFVGPFPIVIGAGPDDTLIIVFSTIIAMLSIAVFLIMNRKLGRFRC